MDLIILFYISWNRLKILKGLYKGIYLMSVKVKELDFLLGILVLLIIVVFNFYFLFFKCII